jgi:nucleoid-associated protein YgaU
MRTNFRDRGWQVLSNLPESQLRPGDVLLYDRGDPRHQHTAMYVGNRQIAMASIDEHQHAFGGQPGDQTGLETKVCPYYDKPWSCVLRFHGTAQPHTPGGLTREYIVKKGDNLSLIASKLLGDANKWPAIYNANKGTIGPDPTIIQPGMKLVIP